MTAESITFITVKSVSRSLPDNHIVICHSPLLEKKAKHNPKEESPYDLGIFVFMQGDQHHPFSLCPYHIVEQHGCGNPPDKKTACCDDTGKGELDRSIYAMAARAATGPSCTQTKQYPSRKRHDETGDRIIAKCYTRRREPRRSETGRRGMQR